MINYISRVSVVAVLGVLVTTLGCSAMFAIEDECSEDKDCESLGANLECRQSLCVAVSATKESNTDDSEKSTNAPATGMDLLGGPCTRIDGMDDPNQNIPEDAVLIGSILPITGELSVAGAYFDHVTLLALEEINRAGGIMGRDVIKVSCDSGTSASQVKEAAMHLKDLGIQAVLGPFSSELVVSVYSDVMREAGMIIVTAGGNAPIISTVSEEGMIWSTSMPASREATAVATHLLESSWERVAVIHRSDTWGNSMFNAFYEEYCSADGIDCTDDDEFLVRSYDVEDPTTSMSAVVTDLTTWGPDITVSFSYIDDGLTFLSIVGTTGAPIRSLLWNNTLASDIIFSLLPAELYPTLCQMQVTTQQMPSGIVYGSFLTRYRARWDGEDPIPYTAAFYDAFYMLAYAYAAASGDDNTAPTGKEIAAAMTRLSSGADINAGAEDWNTGVMTLRASEDSTFNYVGASGEVDFVGGTGSIICPVEAIRFNVGEQSLESVGLIYSASNKYTAPDFSEVDDSVCESNIQP